MTNIIKAIICNKIITLLVYFSTLGVVLSISLTFPRQIRYTSPNNLSQFNRLIDASISFENAEICGGESGGDGGGFGGFSAYLDFD